MSQMFASSFMSDQSQGSWSPGDEDVGASLFLEDAGILAHINSSDGGKVSQNFYDIAGNAHLESVLNVSIRTKLISHNEPFNCVQIAGK